MFVSLSFVHFFFSSLSLSSSSATSSKSNMKKLSSNPDYKSQLVKEICSIPCTSISCNHRPCQSRNPSFIDWYLLLQVDEDAGTEVIRKRYRHLGLEHCSFIQIRTPTPTHTLRLRLSMRPMRVFRISRKGRPSTVRERRDFARNAVKNVQQGNAVNRIWINQRGEILKGKKEDHIELLKLFKNSVRDSRKKLKLSRVFLEVLKL